MDQIETSLEDIELSAMHHLSKILKEYFVLVNRSFNLTAKALEIERQLPSDISNSRLVTTHLLGRVSNDLRCIVILAERGYAMQTASLAACAFEVGYAVAYIGDDEVIADDWLKHCKTTTWCHVDQLIKGALKKLGCHEDLHKEANKIYDNFYRPVASAKHSNPNMQRLHANGPKVIDSGNGPIISQVSVEITEHSLLTALHANVIALCSYVNNHMPLEYRAILNESINGLGIDYLSATIIHNERRLSSNSNI